MAPSKTPTQGQTSSSSPATPTSAVNSPHLKSTSAKQIKSLLHEALSVSHQAVQADSMLHSDPIRSHSLYKECSHRIEHILPFLPEEYATILRKFSKVYLERANRLRDQIMESGSAQGSAVGVGDEAASDFESNASQFGATNSESPSSAQKSSKGHKRLISKSKLYTQSSSSDDTHKKQSSRGMDDSTVRIRFHEMEIPPLGKQRHEDEEEQRILRSLSTSLEQQQKIPSPVNSTPVVEAPKAGNNTTHFVSKVPSNWVHRPFWLMRLLAKSMKHGAHISETLYVPREVWYQRDVNQKYLTHLFAKVEFCEKLYILLKELHMNEQMVYLENNRNANLASLEDIISEFMKSVEREHEALSKSMQASKSKKLFAIGKIYSKVFSSSSGKKSGSSSGSGSDSGSSSSLDRSYNSQGGSNSGVNGNGGNDSVPYVPVLIKLFEQCQFVDKWYRHLEMLQADSSDAPEEDKKQIKKTRQVLESVSMFLYLRLCSFVLSDMHTLLECYLRQMRDSFEDLT